METHDERPEGGAEDTEGSPARGTGPGAKSEEVSLPPVATVDEVAAFLRINRKTLYEAIKRGEIEASTRPVRITRAAVGEWLKGQGCTPSRRRR